MPTERTLRAYAHRHGYRISKSRRSRSYGLYDIAGNSLVLGDRYGYGYDLEEIEAHLRLLTSP